MTVRRTEDGGKTSGSWYIPQSTRAHAHTRAHTQRHAGPPTVTRDLIKRAELSICGLAGQDGWAGRAAGAPEDSFSAPSQIHHHHAASPTHSRGGSRPGPQAGGWRWRWRSRSELVSRKKKKQRAVFCVFSMVGTGCRGIVGFSLNSASIICHENSKFKSDQQFKMCFKNKKILVPAQYISDLLSEVVSSVSAGGKSASCLHAFATWLQTIKPFHRSLLSPVCLWGSQSAVGGPAWSDPVFAPRSRPPTWTLASDWGRLFPESQTYRAAASTRQRTWCVCRSCLMCARNICRQVEALF